MKTEPQESKTNENRRKADFWKLVCGTLFFWSDIICISRSHGMDNLLGHFCLLQFDKLSKKNWELEYTEKESLTNKDSFLINIKKIKKKN